MTIIAATVEKPSEDSKLGVAFSRSGGDAPLVIKSIRPDGLFASTDLKEGMLVHSVMGNALQFGAPKAAADALRQAPAGDVTIEAFAHVASIQKTDKNQKLGISLKNSTTASGIFISNITEDGAFAGSELQVGDKVMYINDILCPPTTKEAIAWIKDAADTLSIIAVPTDLSRSSGEVQPPGMATTPTPTADGVVANEEKKEDPIVGNDRDLETVESVKPQESTAEDAAGEEKGFIDKIIGTCIC